LFTRWCFGAKIKAKVEGGAGRGGMGRPWISSKSSSDESLAELKSPCCAFIALRRYRICRGGRGEREPAINCNHNRVSQGHSTRGAEGAPPDGRPGYVGSDTTGAYCSADTARASPALQANRRGAIIERTREVGIWRVCVCVEGGMGDGGWCRDRVEDGDDNTQGLWRGRGGAGGTNLRPSLARSVFHDKRGIFFSPVRLAPIRGEARRPLSPCCPPYLDLPGDRPGRRAPTMAES